MTNEYQPYAGVLLPPSLQEGRVVRAATLLTAYFAPLTGTNGGYTGGQWDLFDPSSTRNASANVFTADDLLAGRRWRGGLRRSAQARAVQGSNAIKSYTVDFADARRRPQQTLTPAARGSRRR